MSAKVDSAAVQDGYQLYHHCLIFTAQGNWAVVQQGMNEANRYARRYHWLSEQVEDYVVEPHSAICSEARGATLNMVARESEEARQVAAGLAKEKPGRLVKELEKISSAKSLHLPAEHKILVADLHPQSLERLFLKAYERQPEDFKTLLAMEGVGPKTIRALSLISELLYGTPPSSRDPAKFSFAHGGKDGIPYPVDRENYERSIEILRRSLSQARLGNREKLEATKRLSAISEEERK